MKVWKNSNRYFITYSHSFYQWKSFILLCISLNFVIKVPFGNDSSLVQVTARGRTDTTPWPESTTIPFTGTIASPKLITKTTRATNSIQPNLGYENKKHVNSRALFQYLGQWRRNFFTVRVLSKHVRSELFWWEVSFSKAKQTLRCLMNDGFICEGNTVCMNDQQILYWSIHFYVNVRWLFTWW